MMILTIKVFIQINQKVFVSTNVRFSKEDYMMSNRVKYVIDWKALEHIPTLEQRTMGLKIFTPTSHITSKTR